MAHAMQIGRVALREQQGRSPPEIGLIVLRRVGDTIGLWRKRTELRIDLACLDQRMLDDVGLDAYEVRREIRRPFWRKCEIRRADRRA